MIEQRRAARRRHRQSPEGRDDARDRQRDYRRRKADLARAEAQKNVMDQTLTPALTSGMIASASGPMAETMIKAALSTVLAASGIFE